MLWAFKDFSSNGNVRLDYHDENRGFFTIQILSDYSIVVGSDAAWFSFYIYHGWLMWLAWGLLGFI